jgi:hypothetical protein
MFGTNVFVYKFFDVLPKLMGAHVMAIALQLEVNLMLKESPAVVLLWL